KFREDLFYRINTITIEVPPLKDRKEDIPILIDFFLAQAQKEMKKKVNKIENGLMELLVVYDYPGNIRELKNIIERLVVLSDDGVIKKADLPDLKIFNNEENSEIRSLKDVRQIAEIKYIKYVLEKCNGNISESARLMDISRRQLFNKLVEYGIKQ
ncbi:MAG TPA: sigma-54-dependent Fis family transcriptional regulator, partial [Clostridiales bacterium]|nr:sigma-54-dependent Fis family transcriptional regulator [Clostridiales bacterium]